jgi:hypothetical protein
MPPNDSDVVCASACADLFEIAPRGLQVTGSHLSRVANIIAAHRERAEREAFATLPACDQPYVYEYRREGFGGAEVFAIAPRGIIAHARVMYTDNEANEAVAKQIVDALNLARQLTPPERRQRPLRPCIRCGAYGRILPTYPPSCTACSN